MSVDSWPEQWLHNELQGGDVLDKITGKFIVVRRISDYTRKPPTYRTIRVKRVKTGWVCESTMSDRPVPGNGVESKTTRWTPDARHKLRAAILTAGIGSGQAA